MFRTGVKFFALTLAIAGTSVSAQDGSAQDGTTDQLGDETTPVVIDESAISSPVAEAAASGEKSKSPFPDLVTVDGKPVTDEADVGNGKWQLVMIWAISCHVCMEMKPALSKFHNEHKDLNAEVYGVALDGHSRHADVKQYIADHNVSFPSYVGDINMVAANLEINAQIPLRGTPTYLLFKPNGELIAIDYGYLDVDSIDRFISANG